MGVMTCIPTPLEHMNTVGHGIVDPLLTQLESSGIRAISADPAQQECLRQQFAAAREGIDTIVLDEKRIVSGPFDKDRFARCFVIIQGFIFSVIAIKLSFLRNG